MMHLSWRSGARARMLTTRFSCCQMAVENWQKVGKRKIKREFIRILSFYLERQIFIFGFIFCKMEFCRHRDAFGFVWKELWLEIQESGFLYRWQCCQIFQSWWTRLQGFQCRISIRKYLNKLDLINYILSLNKVLKLKIKYILKIIKLDHLNKSILLSLSWIIIKNW